MPDTPYSVITIIFLCLLFYGISLLLVRMGILSRDWQRKFWNSLLLVSIAVAGLIGVLLAITVNFKINMPISDKLLVWQVDFGITLFVLSVFHFTWHSKYYRFLFRAGKVKPGKDFSVVPEPGIVQPEYQLGFNLKKLAFSLGFTAMSTQMILIREFLSVFNGNELVIGIVLGNWMLLSGLGALMNRKATDNFGIRSILIGLFTLAFIPVITLFLLYWLRNIVLPLGGQPGTWQIIIMSGMLLAPFCLYSGWLFSAISQYVSHTLKRNAISLTYGWETIGSMVGGILCSIILVFLFEPFQNIAIVLIINSFILFLISRKKIFRIWKKFHLYLAGAVLIAAATFITRMDRSTIQFLFPGQEVISFSDTPYGKLVVTENESQMNFFENNTLLFTTDNIIANEETVHYALLQRRYTGNVLLVGGGISGVVEECLKYPLKRLDCFEINPRIFLLGKTYNRLPHDARFSMQTGDPRILLKRALFNKHSELTHPLPERKTIDSLDYDAIILNIPEPSTLQINRFYTLEFFILLKTLLNPKGIVTLSLMPTADYIGSNALLIQSTIYQTLKSVFKNVLVIPGEKNYFLASDGMLTTALSGLASQNGIPTEYVNEFYLDDESLLERSNCIMQRIATKAPLNRDFYPAGNYRQLSYWLSYSGNIGFYSIMMLLLLLLIAGGFRAGGITIALFSAGLSSFSLEIILILVFQVMYGYVYLATGIFITLFMAGLAVGVLLAGLSRKTYNYKSLVSLQLISACIIFISLLIILIFNHFTVPTLWIIFLFILLVTGMAAVTGAQFHIASIVKQDGLKKIAATTYSADLLGSATGAILVNAWLVPMWGMTNSLLVIAGVNIMAVLLLLLKK